MAAGTGFVVMACIFFAIYFLPWLLGVSRGVNSIVTLFFFNLVLGWTVLFWLVALIWAVAGQTKAADNFYRAQQG